MAPLPPPRAGGGGPGQSAQRGAQGRLVGLDGEQIVPAAGGQVLRVPALAGQCSASAVTTAPARSARLGGRSVDATARSRQRIGASLRQHPSRSTACLTTLHEPWLLPGPASVPVISPPSACRQRSPLLTTPHWVPTVLLLSLCWRGQRGRDCRALLLFGCGCDWPASTPMINVADQRR